jgi:ABC-type transport system involved in multi-copper enzyme maturation permease subunit
MLRAPGTFVPALFALLALFGIGLGVTILGWGAVDAAFGPLRLRASTADRPLILAAAAGVALLAVGVRHRGWRSVAIVLLVVVAPLLLLLGRVGTTYPVGDGSLIELYTLNAVRGRQVLGAYSQYIWHHPGPLSFYVFAPFYFLGGYSSYGLGVGVLFVNLASLAIVFSLVGRTRSVSVGFAVVLAALLVAFAVRIPQVLSSGWNPHTPLMPLVALLFVTAASLDGRRRLLPLAAFLTSFVIQTHVGFSFVAGLLFLLSALPVLRTLVRDRSRRAEMAGWVVGTAFLLELLWAGPLAEQILKSPGNMTLIARFFFNGQVEQTVAGAWAAWGTMLAGLFRPGFVLAAGSPFLPGDELWSRLAGTLLIVALVPAAIAAWRAQRRFQACLAIACALAALAGLWSVYRVRGLIGDYQIFWLAPIGLVATAVVIGEIAAALDRFVTPTIRSAAIWIASAIALTWIAVIGCRPYVQGSDNFELKADGAMVRRLTNGVLTTLPLWHATHPIVQFDDAVWAISAGLVLQLERANLHTSVAQDMIWLFGDVMASDGTEDVLLTVSRAGRHQELAKRPNNVTIAEGGTFFVDAISLIDDPGARPR